MYGKFPLNIIFSNIFQFIAGLGRINSLSINVTRVFFFHIHYSHIIVINDYSQNSKSISRNYFH